MLDGGRHPMIQWLVSLQGEGNWTQSQKTWGKSHVKRQRLGHTWSPREPKEA